MHWNSTEDLVYCAMWSCLLKLMALASARYKVPWHVQGGMNCWKLVHNWYLSYLLGDSLKPPPIFLLNASTKHVAENGTAQQFLVQSPRSHAETFPSTIFCANICSSHLWTLSLAVHEDETLESLHRCSFCCQILGTFGSFVVEFTDLILPLITNTRLFIRHTNNWMNQRR